MYCIILKREIPESYRFKYTMVDVIPVDDFIIASDEGFFLISHQENSLSDIYDSEMDSLRFALFKWLKQLRTISDTLPVDIHDFEGHIDSWDYLFRALRLQCHSIIAVTPRIHYFKGGYYNDEQINASRAGSS